MNRTPLTLAAVALATLLAAGCNRNETRTAGERADATVAAAERKTENAAERAGNATERAAETVGDKVGDAAITASINAELAKDPDLSALRINVDTANGRVVLRGQAPSARARERAATLAQGVKGVTGVDNQLEVRS
jgi:osmotically-inducible protein OsmY